MELSKNYAFKNTYWQENVQDILSKKYTNLSLSDSLAGHGFADFRIFFCLPPYWYSKS